MISTAFNNAAGSRFFHRLSTVEAERANTQYRWLVLVGLILAAAMELLDTTIMNVALPQMSGNLGTTTQEIAWVSTSYVLSNVVVLPMTAFLNSYFGRRNYLLGSVALFTVASFFCGSSHSLAELIFWRMLQGAGGAALISTSQATLVQVFSKAEQAIVQPLFLMGLVVFPTLGPTIGGFITDSLTWNWCFFINLPIGVLSSLVVFFFLHDTELPKRDVSIDWAGIGLLTVGLGAFQYVLEEGQQEDWFSSTIIVRFAILALVSLSSLIFWLFSKRNTHPIINLRVLKNTSLSGGIVLFIAVGFGLYGVNYLFPLLSQTMQGLSPLQTGLAMLPGGIASAVSIVFCGVMVSSPLDARLQTFAGIVLSIVGMFFLSQLQAGSGVNDTFWPMLIRGASVGFLFVPVNQMAIGSLSREDVNEGAGLLGLGRQLGGSIGVAIVATALQNSIHIDRSYLVSNIASTNPAYQERISAFTSSLVGHGYGVVQAQQAAIGLVDQALTQQVLAKAFNDTFSLLLIVSVAMIPVLLLLRKPRPGAGAAAMH